MGIILCSSLHGYTQISNAKVNKRDTTINDRKYYLQDVQVFEKSTNQLTKEKAFHITAIELKQLENTNRDLQQILNRSAGIKIRESGGLGSNFEYNLNGFSGRQIKFFIDGIPLENFNSAFGLQTIPVNNAERIEVYKGVVPIEFGADVLGAAVNIISKQRSNNFIDFSYSYSSFNTHRVNIITRQYNKKSNIYHQISGQYNYSDNNYKVLVEIPDMNTGKIQLASWRERFHDTYESKNVQWETGIINRKWTDKLSLSLLIAESYKQIQTGSTMDYVIGAAYTKDVFINPKIAYKKDNVLFRGLNYISSYQANISNNLIADTSSRRYDWTGNYVQRNDLSLGEIAWWKSRFKFNDKYYNSTQSLNYTINPKHQISFNYTYHNYWRKGEDPLSKYPIAFSEPNILTKHIFGWSLNTKLIKERYQQSLFVKYNIQRAETFYARYGDYESKKIRYDNIGYGFANNYKLGNSTLIKFSIEHTNRLPDAAEIFGNGLLVLNNPDLQAEVSTNLNLGVLFNKFIYDHFIGFEIVGIYRNTDNLIRIEATGLTSQYINLRSAKTQGLEGEIRYRYKRFVQIAINSSYQNIINTTEFENNSNKQSTVYLDRLPNIPYFFTNVDVQINFNKNKFFRPSLAIAYTHVEEYFLFWPSLGNKDSKKIIPQQSSIDMSMQFSSINNKYHINLECRNITDALLYDNFRLQKPGRNFGIKLRINI